jgi:hypothetical protein
LKNQKDTEVTSLMSPVFQSSSDSPPDSNEGKEEKGLGQEPQVYVHSRTALSIWEAKLLTSCCVTRLETLIQLLIAIIER